MNKIELQNYKNHKPQHWLNIVKRLDKQYALYKNYLLYDNETRKIKKPIKMQFCGVARTKEADEIISFM